jgi:hypothetical protein
MRRSRTAPSRANKPASVHSTPSTQASASAQSPPQPPPPPPSTAAPAPTPDPEEPAPGAAPLLVEPWFDSAAGVQSFHDAARDALLDLAAAAREGARRPHKRVLSRAEIRRQAREGYARLASLLDLAVEALSRRVRPAG